MAQINEVWEGIRKILKKYRLPWEPKVSPNPIQISEKDNMVHILIDSAMLDTDLDTTMTVIMEIDKELDEKFLVFESKFEFGYKLIVLE